MHVVPDIEVTMHVRGEKEPRTYTQRNYKNVVTFLKNNLARGLEVTRFEAVRGAARAQWEAAEGLGTISSRIRSLLPEEQCALCGRKLSVEADGEICNRCMRNGQAPVVRTKFKVGDRLDASYPNPKQNTRGKSLGAVRGVVTVESITSIGKLYVKDAGGNVHLITDEAVWGRA